MMDTVSQELEDERPVPSGITGLDEILVGGFSRGNVHLVEGSPGTGKTTLGLQFLLDGRERGERCLYVTLSETKRELMRSARTHGWSLDGIEIFELVPPELTLDPEQEQTLVYASDLELGETGSVIAAADRIGPSSGARRKRRPSASCRAASGRRSSASRFRCSKSKAKKTSGSRAAWR